jgi:hypothetical protein
MRGGIEFAVAQRPVAVPQGAPVGVPRRDLVEHLLDARMWAGRQDERVPGEDVLVAGRGDREESRR